MTVFVASTQLLARFWLPRMPPAFRCLCCPAHVDLRLWYFSRLGLCSTIELPPKSPIELGSQKASVPRLWTHRLFIDRRRTLWAAQSAASPPELEDAMRSGATQLGADALRDAAPELSKRGTRVRTTLMTHLSMSDLAVSKTGTAGHATWPVPPRSRAGNQRMYGRSDCRGTGLRVSGCPTGDAVRFDAVRTPSEASHLQTNDSRHGMRWQDQMRERCDHGYYRVRASRVVPCDVMAPGQFWLWAVGTALACWRG